MTKERPTTAAELYAKLQADPEFQRREKEKERERDRLWKKYDELLKPYLTQLHELGYEGDTLEDIVKDYCPLPEPPVGVLLSAISDLSEPRVLESVVRTLGAANHSFDGRPLARCFESTYDESLKWAIANTIALVHPHSIDDWLFELCEKSPYWKKTLTDLGLKM